MGVTLASSRPTTAIQPSCYGVEVGRCRQSSHYPTKAQQPKITRNLGTRRPRTPFRSKLLPLAVIHHRNDKRWCFSTLSRDRRHGNRRSTLLANLATGGEGAPGPCVQHVILQIVLPAQQRST